ncbi:MAG: Na+/H+ antiporter NhaA type, partial [uncultured Microvirga sp.]
MQTASRSTRDLALRGFVDALSFPAWVLGLSLFAVGSLAREVGFPAGAAVLSTVIMWAGPAQVIFFGGLAAGTALPFIAAAAGMVVPAAVYLGVTAGNADLTDGWAIPAATDIAFALGVLALLGSRAPTSLKLFLTTVAIVDDMGAVAIIAFAYTSSLDTLALGVAAAITLILYVLGKSDVRSLAVYLIGAALLWYAVLLSGVHATIAGVVAALTVPLVKTPGAPDSPHSPLHILEHALAKPVAFLIVPV